MSENATLNAPKLETSGYIEVSENATLNAPKLAEKLRGLGYYIDGDTLIQGIYFNLTKKEAEYLLQIKPLIESDKLVMSTWHENNNWKDQTVEEVIGCGTTHCVAGWIQIFEKDKYNNISAEECGNRCAPNLKTLFFKSEEEVELAIETFTRS